MKVSDYIVEFLENKGIDHCFGYQGTMIAHLVDSICNSEKLQNHCCYNEQGAAFAAVGYAKATGKLGFAYATSGPGAVNLVSGVADAYYDSTPVIFITGQLNTYEYTGIEGLRQHGFQEMDVVSTVKAVTKYCVKVEHKEDIRYILEKAYYMATEGRPGPVVIDLPMNIQREFIEVDELKGFEPEEKMDEVNYVELAQHILNSLSEAKAPVLVLGNGIQRGSNVHKKIIHIAEMLSLPIITSMLGRDLLEYEHRLNFGHVGAAYGHRYSNMILHKKADLIVALGCSLCKRQTGMNTEKFAEKAKIIRVDIDPKELIRKVHHDEEGYLADAGEVISCMAEQDLSNYSNHEVWSETCRTIRDELIAFDASCEERKPNFFVEMVSENVEPFVPVCCDVGQHQVWTSQSFKVKEGQSLLFSGGHGAMGFALPASIGAHYGTGKRSVAISGDGSMQMNIQELQWVAREQVPVTIVVLNNSSLGLIQQQQDDIFESRYYGSLEVGGYTSPNFEKIGEAYGIPSYQVDSIEGLDAKLKEIDCSKPALIEVVLDIKSRAFPKTNFGEEIHNQKPYIPTELMERLLGL